MGRVRVRLFATSRNKVAVSMAVLLALVLAAPVVTNAQLANCTISGTVYDASGAVVPDAKVLVKDRATGSTREGKSNGSGFFSFPSLLPGTYDVTIKAGGFKTWEQRAIPLNNAESRSMPNILLEVGTAAETVTVETGIEAIAPISTGASSTTLTNELVNNIAIQGRDAAEFIRLMPSMAMNTGLGQTQWDSHVTQSNNGPIGAFAASGTPPNGGLQMVMNGSVIVDAGNQGTQIANVNQDQTEEMQIHDASFDAEFAHGPVVLDATGKRGTQKFHGGAYVYTRNGSLNSMDSYYKAAILEAGQTPVKHIDHYWYPGFTLGGPIILPLTNFNKNKDRAYFFVGYEYMKQNPVGNLHQYVAPTSYMVTPNASGNYDFSPVSSQFGSQWPAGDVPNGNCYGKDSSGNATATTYPITNGVIPGACVDPSGLAYLKLMTQAPGVSYLNNSTGYNAQFLDSPPVNRYDLNVRGDVEVIKNKMTVWGSYTRQPETDLNNIAPWWWPNGSLPYPSGQPASQLSYAYSFGATNTFSPSLTNEAVFGYAYFINPIKLANADAVNPSKVGYSVATPYQQLTPQIPNIVSWCCGGAGGNINSTANSTGFFAPAFGTNWSSGGAFGKDSFTPSFTDNVTKVIRNHTLKGGFFWASYANVQTEGFGSGPNGQWNYDMWCNGSTSNIFADILTGQGACNFSQTNTIPVDNVKYHEYAFYGQDQWKASRRLTLNFGVRFNHEGQWFPTGSSGKEGLAVWDASTYNKTANGLTGFVWKGLPANVPVSGFHTTAIYPDPHVGVAYDVFGTGRTVLRGGFGLYRFQVAYNDVTENNLLDGPLGVLTYTSNCTFRAMSDLTLNKACVAPGSSSLDVTPAGRAGITQGGMLRGDDKTPYTQSWSVIVDQRVPWHSLLTLKYTGNRSRDLLLTANGGGGISLNSINYIPQGGLFGADPVTGVTYYCQGTASATCVPDRPDSSVIPHYRPYDYSQVNLFRHGSYSNYNAFVAVWQKQTGRSVFNLNYTYSKVLGIRDGNNDNGGGAGASLDSFHLARNYGTLAFNRTHLFNAMYVIGLGNPIKDNVFLEQVVNGWHLSGVTQYQSGPPLQPLTGGSLNAGYGNLTLNGATYSISNQSILGTDGIKLVPMIICNPKANLHSGQYFNPACFAEPTTRGVNGSLVWPNITGPGFFTSDLGLYKDFRLHESHVLQFRITAFNFLNHANDQFGLTNDVNLTFGNAAGPGSVVLNNNLTTDGKPHFTVGRRMMELALKYSF